MKAICIVTSSPVDIRVAPDSAFVPRLMPWFIPDECKDETVAGQVFIGAVIDRLGKNIEPRFAQRYYSQLTTAVHPQTPLTCDALTWTRDGAIAQAPSALPVSESNAEPALLSAIDQAIALASQYMTVRTGDLILIPSPDAEVLPLKRSTNVNVAAPTGFPTFTLKVR